MKFLNLQVSNGLEILLSMGNRLTLNIRSESAYGIGEVLKRFTKRPSGRVSFSFTRGYSGVQNFPTVGLFEGRMRTTLEETGMPYQSLINLYLLDCVNNKRTLKFH